MITKTWPAGYNFSDRRTLTRGGVDGDLAVRYSPGTGNEFMLLGGTLTNQEAALARVMTSRIMTSGGNRLYFIASNGALAAAASQTFPTQTAGANNLAPIGPILVAGADMLEARLAAVSATEDALFEVQLRCLNGDPTITEVNA